MEKIYWNKAAGQIVTKDGVCLYDQKWQGNYRKLQCSARGHKMRFNGGSEGQLYTSGFPFVCWRCGLEIIKTKKELSATEEEALKKLKLLK